MSPPYSQWCSWALLLISLLVSACNAGTLGRGASRYQALPPDTVTNACLRGSVNCPAVMGESAAAAMHPRVAEVGASLAGAARVVEYLHHGAP